MDGDEEGFDGFNSPNPTMDSMDKGVVIIVTPEDPDFFRDPLEVSRSIENSQFSKYTFERVRSNKERKNVTFQVFEKDKALIPKLMKIETLGKWKVTCSQPTSDIRSYGVIQNVDLGIDLSNLIPEMETRYEDNIEILKLERMQRKTDLGWVDCESVKVTFAGKSLPRVIIISKYSQFKVRPYVSLPRQCYNCQRLHHMAKSCTAKMRCLICSGEHNKKDCDRPNNPKCANCGGAHVANSKFCSIYSMEQEIEKVRAKKQIVYTEARNLVLDAEYGNDEVAGTRRKTYKEVLAPTQATPVRSSAVEQGSNSSNLDMTTILKMMKKCITDILTDVLKTHDFNTDAISDKVESHFASEFDGKDQGVTGGGQSSSSHEDKNIASDSSVNSEELKDLKRKTNKNANQKKHLSTTPMVSPPKTTTFKGEKPYKKPKHTNSQ